MKKEFRKQDIPSHLLKFFIKKAGNPQFKASEEEIRRYRKNAKFQKFFNDKQELNNFDREINATWDKTGDLYNPNGKNIPNIWLIGTEPSTELHFARFPSALCEIPIKSSCPPNGIVCDPFSGSGTTLKVARDLGRNYLGIELNADYIKLAEKRLSQQVLI